MSPLAPLVFALAVQEPAPAPAPIRVRLFDRMDRAEWSPEPAVEDAAPAPPTARRFDFEDGEAPKRWFGRFDGRDPVWADDAGAACAIVPEGGVSGGALRIGPGIAEERSFVTFVVRARPLTHYVLRGRVKLVNHPSSDDASAREVVRVMELAGTVDDPTTVHRFDPRVRETHRVGREIVPGGWDRFELEIPLSQAGVGTLQVGLMHRTGGSDRAETWFDEIELVETPLDERTTWRILLDRCRPDDGDGEATPWRLRVTLPTPDFVKEETRDALLLPPPRSLTIPLEVPAPASQPVLRFAVGMLPEAAQIPGDGARVSVAFTPSGGAPVELGSVELDPKGDRRQRCWRHARFDLAAVAGRDGALTFRASDPGERDPFDAVVIATPRIEPGQPTPPPARESAHGPFNVLVIASDTLRADRLSAFGYHRPTSPHLERLARAGTRFTKARSQAPWTLPSFSSILTSMYPSEHGAGRGGRDEWTPLDPGVTTLADVLARVGYQTAGITANHLISPEYGLDQGFESYAVPGELQWQRQGMESVDLDAPLVVRFLEEHRATPFFLFWHVMDPHLPYTTSAAMREPFAERDYAGRFAAKDPIVPFQVLDPRPGRRWFTHEGPPKPPPLTEADRRFVSDYYDAEIREIDAAIGTVLDALERTGLWESTIVALIADHGEGLGEHGHYHHGYTLFEDQVHVPMLVRVPGLGEGATIAAPAASIDLAPTVVAALGLTPPESFRGVSRLPALAQAAEGEAAGEVAPDAAALAAEPIFLEYPSYDSSAQKAVILGDFKYLHDPWFRTEALFDTARDPLEATDVKAQHPELVARARALLDEFRWERTQQGRFHLRVRARRGARLEVKVATDDLFDANFATRPQLSEEEFTLDLDRRHLAIATTTSSEAFELVCWCRGERMRFEVTLDGEPLESGIRVGAETEARPVPLAIARRSIPTIAGATLAPPEPLQAVLWMEPGAGNVEPVVPTPEEADVLRALGYAQ